MHTDALAFKALFNSHLYGRHLVLEWAQDDDSVETLRAKTARKVLQRAEPPARKQRRVDDAALEAAKEDAGSGSEGE